jgi:hypothetical protein
MKTRKIESTDYLGIKRGNTGFPAHAGFGDGIGYLKGFEHGNQNFDNACLS